MAYRPNPSTRNFVVGTQYRATSVCDSNCHWDYTVQRRTAKSVWLLGADGEVIMRRVSVYMGVEQVNPKGSYSMAPILGADRPMVKAF